jgi:chemotaxis methyl-accepting protein methylase
MFKIGITTLQQLLRTDESCSRLIGAHLLMELDGLDAETAARQRERIIRRMILPNTTGKTTWKDRFKDLDEEVVRVLEARRADSLRCLDIGVSDGTTSLDLLSRLSQVGRLEYVMTDLNEALYIRKSGPWVDVCNDEGTLIQVVIGPFVVPVTHLRHMHPLQIINRLLYLYAAHVRRRGVARAWQTDRQMGTRIFHSESLLAAEVQRVMGSNQHLRFERMDILSPSHRASEYDFVRVLNVLNLAQGGFGFSPSDARKGLKSVLSMVAPEGYLLVGRTSGREEQIANATLLQEQGGRFVALKRFGTGSELEPFLFTD